jgi:hypothetical protein
MSEIKEIIVQLGREPEDTPIPGSPSQRCAAQACDVPHKAAVDRIFLKSRTFQRNAALHCLSRRSDVISIRRSLTTIIWNECKPTSGKIQ